MLTEKTIDMLIEDLDGLCVQMEQMAELARLENRKETYLYKNILKVLQRDLSAITRDMDIINCITDITDTAITEAP